MARLLKIPAESYDEFRQTMRELIDRGRVVLGRGRVVRLPSEQSGIVGVYRSIRKGGGFVVPRQRQGATPDDIYVRPHHKSDAATGDVVLVQIVRKKAGDRRVEGKIVEIIERASRDFVGTYFTRSGEAFVHVDGGVFHEPVYVGDPGVKNACDGDKVVFEMLRFPSVEMFGEGVVREVLGPHGDPDVDVLSVLRQFKIPDTFSESALAEARTQARQFESEPFDPTREDLSDTTIVTIDPVDARDFDDAVSLHRDEHRHWRLGVHIADVAEFVRAGGVLDAEARSRATSVYLPGRVIPMLPELISNGLASLQENKPRYTKSVFVDFDPAGHITGVRFANSIIRVTKRLAYEQVQELFDKPHKQRDRFPTAVADLLLLMRELASILRSRRRERGFLELAMPEAKVELDADGHVTGAVYREQDESHRVIEEFMLTANEAVAQELDDRGIHFLRRVHSHPDPLKLLAFMQFVQSLGMETSGSPDRFELQRIAREAQNKPEAQAIHYALLRSMKEAIYSPEPDGHYALASSSYCHFTSPIRRYPDLTVHRLLDELIRKGRATGDRADLVALGEHCSFAERRAQKAERELLKIKVLEFMSDKVSQEMEMVVTGVEEFGLFCQAKGLPAEGLVHVRSLPADYYVHDAVAHALTGQRSGAVYRLGMNVRCLIAQVDLSHRQLDLRLVTSDRPRARKPTRSPQRKGRRPPPKKATKSRGNRKKSQRRR